MSLEAPQSKNYERQKLDVKMAIQRALVERYTGVGKTKEEQEADAFKWIDANSAKFRELFAQKLIDEPNFLEDFEHDKEKYISEFESALGAEL